MTTIPARPEFICRAGPLTLPGMDAGLYAIEFDLTAYRPALFQYYQIAQPAALAGAVNKRQAEYLAGRLCARQLTQAAGLGSIEIPSTASRVPQWPTGFTGSISHHNHSALCALAPCSQYQGLGIDTEQWITADTAQLIKGNIINSNELALFNWMSENTRTLMFEQWLTLVFSLKESLFKAVFPAVGVWFEFMDAELTGIDIKTNTCNIKLNRSLNHPLSGSSMPAGRIFNGNFLVRDHDVITSVFY
ncbi:MAG: 4'-phosphopantetheinyl transferase superfamily protein [Marinobacterium sp.]|nr:4'-phosphopantetheinyl transferase superfamily protein [Marinobacterium sp.]